jgi:hypothetical protein
MADEAGDNSQMNIHQIIRLLIAIFFLGAAFTTITKEKRWKNIANKKTWGFIAGSIIMFICGLVLLINSIAK